MGICLWIARVSGVLDDGTIHCARGFGIEGIVAIFWFLELEPCCNLNFVVDLGWLHLFKNV